MGKESVVFLIDTKEDQEIKLRSKSMFYNQVNIRDMKRVLEIASSTMLGKIFIVTDDDYLKKAEVVLILTQSDEYNFYVAKLCKQNYGICNVITILNNSDNKSIFNSIGVEKIIESDEYGKEAMFMYMVRNN